MNFKTVYDYLFNYQNALQTSTLIAELTRRLYSVHAARSQRAHDALEDPTVCCLTRCGNAKPWRLF